MLESGRKTMEFFPLAVDTYFAASVFPGVSLLVIVVPPVGTRWDPRTIILSTWIEALSGADGGFGHLVFTCYILVYCVGGNNAIQVFPIVTNCLFLISFGKNSHLF